MKRILLIFLISVYALSTNAQTSDDPWWLNIQLVNNKFQFGDVESLYDFGEFRNTGVRIGVQRYLSKSFDLELGTSYGKLIHENLYESNLFDLNARINYKLDNGYILKEESKIAPFLMLGGGLANYEENDNDALSWDSWEGSHFSAIYGVGVELKATEEASVRLTVTRNSNSAPDYMQYGLGVNFSLGGKRDSDGDGVRDKEDACPNQVGPVENKGCPWPDTDNDGVLDKDDQCKTEAGPRENNGCPWPDSDGDGVLDKDDKCPKVAGIARFNGCPDTDGDGIQDSQDACPNEPGTLNGCPDRDGDGVKDSEDQCPGVAGTLNGCPDSDGDGIRNQDDNCPQTAGSRDNGGCPVIEEEVQQVLDLAVKSIQFNSGSDVLRTFSYAALNQVADLMKENDTFNLKLSGYTDNTGRAETNLALSDRRANAVKQYLVSQGVSTDRITAMGYGIANPIADNNTREGRAANRRVELEIVFN